MLIGDMPLIIDYSLCQQTVTVYRKDGDIITRTVHSPAYMEVNRTERLSKDADELESTALVVIPGAASLSVGDRVFDGIGPDVPSVGMMTWWRSFIPAKVDGLIVLRQVAQRKWRGEVAHVEGRA